MSWSTPPTLLTPASGSTVLVINPQFTWTPNPLADYYQLQLYQNMPVGSPTWSVVYDSGAYMISGGGPITLPYFFQAGGKYRWRMRTYKTLLGWSTNWGGYFTFDYAGPEYPNPPVLTSPGEVGIPGPRVSTLNPTLNWQASAGPGTVDGYHVYVSGWDSVNSAWIPLFDYALGNVVTYTMADALWDGGQYKWEVSAHNTTAGWGSTGQSLYFYIQLGNIAPPGLQSPGNGIYPGPDEALTAPVFHWIENPSATGYGLYIDHWNGAAWVPVFNSEAVPGTPLPGDSYPLSAGILSDGEKYRWRMTSYDGSTYGNPNTDYFYFVVNTAAISDPQTYWSDFYNNYWQAWYEANCGPITYPDTGFSGTPEIPPGGPMDYYMGRIWWAKGRVYTAGDIVGSTNSGTSPYKFRDSIVRVTENPLATGGDGFAVPSNAGNITALTHPANLDAALGQGRLTILAPESVFQLAVPVTRSDWQSTGPGTEPLQSEVQIGKGTLAERSTVSHNGDLFYQGSDNSVRSLATATRFFGTWANTAISSEVNRAFKFNDMELMRFASGIVFDDRLLQTCLPVSMAQGAAFQGVVPLDFDVINTLKERLPPAWDGMWEGLNILQMFRGRFNGQERAFAVVAASDGGIDIWEMTDDEKVDDGSKRIVWGFETPAYTGKTPMEFIQLDGGELWLDDITGTVDLEVFYRVDGNPCWQLWHRARVCAAGSTCEDTTDPMCEDATLYQSGSKYPLTLPKPPMVQDEPINDRPMDRGYQFQMKVNLKGWCRIRGYVLYTLPLERGPFEGMK